MRVYIHGHVHLLICNAFVEKGKAVPLQAWTSREGSRILRLPDFKTIAHEGGKVVSSRTGRLYHPGNIPGTHFC